MQRILVGSPVRQHPEILREFLRSLGELAAEALVVDYLFVDDNDDPVSSELLATFRPTGTVTILPTETATIPYQRDDATHHWLPDNFSRVAQFKDGIIAHARDHDYDGLFFIDSDLVLHPQTLRFLIAANVDICSEAFWTSWEIGAAPLPQCWLQDQYRFVAFRHAESLSNDEVSRRADEFVAQLRVPGVYEVGGLGACTLIRRRALAAGVSFRTLPNLSLVGEDRHFCVRAVALGFKLHVDTHVPPLHLYRHSDLSRVADFRDAIAGDTIIAPDVPAAPLAPVDRPLSAPNVVLPPAQPARHAPNAGLVLSMVVQNEADRFLRRVLRHAASYVDAAVIIDDASTDNTVDVCEELLADIPHTIVSLPDSLFHRESELRKIQWDATMERSPTWILNLDADEVFEDAIRGEIGSLLAQSTWDSIAFRLYDFWDEFHYREDAIWNAHSIYRPFLVRVTPDLTVEWPNQDQHAGRFPAKLFDQLSMGMSDVRIKHLGWSTPRERHRKYERYLRLDPSGRYGNRAQYDSILDLRPTLRRWDEAPGR